MVEPGLAPEPVTGGYHHPHVSGPLRLDIGWLLLSTSSSHRNPHGWLCVRAVGLFEMCAHTRSVAISKPLSPVEWLPCGVSTGSHASRCSPAPGTGRCDRVCRVRGAHLVPRSLAWARPRHRDPEFSSRSLAFSVSSSQNGPRGSVVICASLLSWGFPRTPSPTGW